MNTINPEQLALILERDGLVEVIEASANELAFEPTNKKNNRYSREWSYIDFKLSKGNNPQICYIDYTLNFKKESRQLKLDSSRNVYARLVNGGGTPPRERVYEFRIPVLSPVPGEIVLRDLKKIKYSN